MLGICIDCATEGKLTKQRCRRCYSSWYNRERRRQANPYLRTWESARPGYKICRKCEQELPTADFGRRKTGKSGLASWCRPCLQAKARADRAADPRAREKERAYELRPDVAERIRVDRAARQYDVHRDVIANLHAAQQGRCAVCGKTRKLAVDHCHSSGRVRGLLCYPCNIALGQVNDDADLLHKLAAYVARHRATS